MTAASEGWNRSNARALFALCFGRSTGHMAVVGTSPAVLVLARELNAPIPDDGLDFDEIPYAANFLRNWADALEGKTA